MGIEGNDLLPRAWGPEEAVESKQILRVAKPLLGRARQIELKPTPFGTSELSRVRSRRRRCLADPTRGWECVRLGESADRFRDDPAPGSVELPGDAIGGAPEVGRNGYGDTIQRPGSHK